MSQLRLKSSFIYLANAVNDLRAQRAVLAMVLAPLVLIAALCVLPDAINLQHAVAEHFTPGARHVGWFGAQAPYAPTAEDVKPLVPWWAIGLLNLLALVLTFGANLLILCSVRRLRSGQREERLVSEAIATWREAIRLVWDGLEGVLSAPSPSFDAKKKIFEERGYRVVEVPLFAWGEGGLHCLVLH